MKLNRTREEWAVAIGSVGKWPEDQQEDAWEDLATLFAEVERLRGALKAISDGDPFNGWMSSGSLQGVNIEHFNGMEDGYFIASEAGRQALGDTHD